MKRIIIFTGGSIDIDFLRQQDFSGKENVVICADHGLKAAHDLSLLPQFVVGDFDSAGKELLAEYEGRKDVTFVRFPPEKDDTDTELALHMAMDMEPEEILIFGGFGTRLDHTLANIGLLKQPLERGIKAVLCDPYNKIRMVSGEYRIQKTEAFGDYVSILPFGKDAKGVTLAGFQYPLKDALMPQGCSLGVSNEIVEEEAVITVKEGILLVIESRDGFV